MKYFLSKPKTGRKSMKREKATLDLLESVLFNKINEKKLRSYIKKGKYSIFDRFLLRSIEGQDKYLIAIFNKVFPDKTENTLDISPIKIEVTKLDKPLEVTKQKNIEIEDNSIDNSSITSKPVLKPGIKLNSITDNNTIDLKANVESSLSKTKQTSTH